MQLSALFSFVKNRKRTNIGGIKNKFENKTELNILNAKRHKLMSDRNECCENRMKNRRNARNMSLYT